MIYAGEAHTAHLASGWTVDANFDNVSAAPADAETAIYFRCGFMLSDDIGSRKGRAYLRIQHTLPDARVIYVSVTGATSVHNLADAQHLGLGVSQPAGGAFIIISAL